MFIIESFAEAFLYGFFPEWDQQMQLLLSRHMFNVFVAESKLTANLVAERMVA